MKKRRSFEAGHLRKFLLIVDNSEEVEAALYYAASRIAHSSGMITMLFVIEPLFLHRRLATSAIPQADFERMQRFHQILVTLALITLAGAVGGSHGLF